jgi:hypothetical protein
MAAILDSLGFTFLIDRMTEVLTPDIYIELTDPNPPCQHSLWEKTGAPGENARLSAEC